MSNKIKAEFMDVTPEWAAARLDEHFKNIEQNNYRQRRISNRNVTKYAADMKHGNWLQNGQGISFDENGNLTDGQHRLMAVVRAKVTVRMLVITGLQEQNENGVKTIYTVDTGRPRTFGQQVALERGGGHPYTLASISRCLYVMANGLSENVPMTAAQGWGILALFERNIEEILRLITNGSQSKNQLSYLVAPIVLLRSSQKDVADQFAREYASMANQKEGSPIIALHKWFARPLNTGMRGRVYVAGGLTATATALQYFSGDKTVSYLKGDPRAMEWLLNSSKNAVRKVQEIIETEITVETLRR
jgi:hypothetical protein